MSLYVSGSIAFDKIMSFGGNFKDSMIADKLDCLSVSFLVDSLDERRGGCGGNIAYSLALLGEKPILISAVGKDFAEYGKHLEAAGVSLEALVVDESTFTANCFITTDQHKNQITGFYPGAMSHPHNYAFEKLSPDDIAIVSPGNVQDMKSLPAFYKEKGIRYIFDPGQQIPIFSADFLREAMEGSYAYICNDYELGMTCQKMGCTEEDILSLTQYLIETQGENGSRVRGPKGLDVQIPTVPCSAVVDPTGAGDSYRSGLLLGLQKGLALEEAAKLGAVTASFAIEHMGTQEHHFTVEEFCARYEASFGKLPFSF